MKTNFNCISNIVTQTDVTVDVVEFDTKVKDVDVAKDKDVDVDVEKEKPKTVEIVEDFDAFGGDASAYDNDAGEDEEEDETGGGIEDLDKKDKDQYNLKNPNFAVNRLASKYTLKLPGIDYNRK